VEVNGYITPGHFTPEEESQYPLNRRLGGPQSRSGHFVEEKNPLALLGYELRTVQPVTSYYTNYTILAIYINSAVQMF
jgi:hypothetical protein